MVHADTGLLGLTTKHIYHAGSRKKFRIRYDRIISFDPYEDGFSIMRDNQTARPQTFITKLTSSSPSRQSPAIPLHGQGAGDAPRFPVI